MIPPGYVSLRAAFAKLAQFEGRVQGRGPHAASEAAGRLLYSLVTGQLGAFRVDPQGTQPAAIPTGDWTGRDDSFKQDIIPFDAFQNVVVREDELAAMLGLKDSDASPARRGRKPYDADAVWAVIALTAHDEGFAESQEKMIRSVQHQYELSFGKDTAPGRTTLQPMIQKLFAEKAKNDAKAKAGK